MSSQNNNLYQFAVVVNGADVNQIYLSVQQSFQSDECNQLSLSIDLSTTREHPGSDLEEEESTENINSFGFA